MLAGNGVGHTAALGSLVECLCHERGGIFAERRSRIMSIERNGDGTIMVVVGGDVVAEFDTAAEAAEWLAEDAERLEAEAKQRRDLAQRIAREHAA